MKWFPKPAAPGDVIRVGLNGVFHYGIFVSEDEVIQFGLPPLPKYRKDGEAITVLATDLEVFSCGQVYETAVSDWKERLKGHSRKETVRIARSRLGEGGYNLLHHNCEHFVYECAYGVSHSEQEQAARRRWKERPVLDVYLAFSEDAGSQEPVEPPAREKYIRETGDPALRAARRQVWNVLKAAAEHSLDCSFPKVRFRKNRYGKWECDSFQFSLSHTEGAVAAAVSNGRVGVDVENTESFAGTHGSSDALNAMAEKSMTPGELLRFENDPNVFLPIWTRKECLYKRDGNGPFVPTAIDTEQEPAQTRFLRERPLCISVCGEHLPYVRYFLLRGGVPEQLFAPSFREGGEGG